jgi:uncharacterized damage-inducible protein DinB
MENKTALLEGLRQAPAILSAFVADIPEDKLDRRRGDGFWTIAEHLSHLAHVQPMLLERIQRFIDEERPEFVPYIPGEQEDEPATPERMAIDAALSQFSAIRTRQLSLLESAPDATWRKQAGHPEYDRYGFRILVRHILMHDHWHMYRMEELWLTKTPFLTRME